MADIAVFPLAEDWRFGSIFERSNSAEGLSGWYHALAETTLAPCEEAVVVIAVAGKAVRAALPLVRKGHAMRALTAPYTTVYAPAFADMESARLLGASAHLYVPGSLRLDALDPADPAMAAFLDGMKYSGLSAVQYPHFANFYEPIRTFEEYWKERPSRLRTTVRRRLAHAQAHEPGFRYFRNSFGEAIKMYEDVYRASWKTPEPHPDFMENMVDKLARHDAVRVGIMTFGGKPVAAQIWLVCKRKATIFKLAHREDVLEYSPGTLLTHWMASTLVRDEALEEIDFGRGNDAYKRDWLGRDRLRIGVVAGNWRTKSGRAVIAGEVLPTRLAAFGRRAVERARRALGRPGISGLNA